ncbi:hypothetical protein ACFL4D_00250 [Candidatus Margulisiibacteriota bacterium]
MKLILSSINNAAKVISGHQNDTALFFLDNDYTALQELQTVMPSNIEYIDLGDSLLVKTSQLRRPYLDYIGGLSKELNSLAWWVSRISEKNVMVSPLFLYICYLELFKEESLKIAGGQDICVVSSNPALLELIANLYKGSGTWIVRKYSNSRLAQMMKIELRAYAFLGRSVSRRLWAYLSRRKDINSPSAIKDPVTIIRTWTGDKNFGEDGSFKDSYFGQLADYLKGRGERIVVLPVLFSIKRSIKETFALLRQSEVSFLVPEDYLRSGDYWQAIFTGIKSLFLFNREFIFSGQDISLLFRQEARRTALEAGQLEFCLQYYLLRRLKKKGLIIRKLIITFENMFPEKPILLGLKKYYPETASIGYQHSVFFPLLLSLYTSTAEAEVLPLPDRISCSGKFFKRKMAEEGYPADVLREGAAIRFKYLLGTEQKGALTDEVKTRILITLPLAAGSALELLSKTWVALRQRSQLEVWLKAHPMMGNEVLNGLLNRAGIPEGSVKVVGGTMAEVLGQVGIVAATASGTIFDALAFGLPVLRIRQDLDLNLDPLDWFPPDELQFIARTPEAIGSQLDRIMSLTAKDYKTIRERGQQLIADCFNPADEEHLEVFE